MSKILTLDSDYDLWLSYTWSNNNHGICGHTFEVIDYYHILKDHFKVGILIGEDMDWATLELAIRSKYDFTEAEISDIWQNTTFAKKPSLVRGTNILFTDGGVVNNSSKTMIFKNIFYFACGNREIKTNDRDNVYVLQDDRVYEPVKKNGIHYVKKILFDRLKPLNECADNFLLYATKNCRNIDNYEIFVQQYGDNIIAITNQENTPTESIDGITFLNPPVDNIFEQFTTYIYTPINRKWDCSPRFIAECRYYGKQVIYHDINYWSQDHGLRVRKYDIENTFDRLFLRPNDPLVNILKGIIC
jgi:hypothetical protein